MKRVVAIATAFSPLLILAAQGNATNGTDLDDCSFLQVAMQPETTHETALLEPCATTVGTNCTHHVDLMGADHLKVAEEGSQNFSVEMSVAGNLHRPEDIIMTENASTFLSLLLNRVGNAALNPFTAQPVHESTMVHFPTAPRSEWMILVVSCCAMVLFDLFVLRQAPASFFGHIAVIGIWVTIAAAFGAGIVFRMGVKKGVEWYFGYILEWMLSMDNLFIFHLVFQTFKTPSQQVHKAVFTGLVGAVVMRLLFFMVLSTLLHLASWFRWPFGLMLIWSGVQAATGDDDDEEEVSDTPIVKGLRWCLGDRLLQGYDEVRHSMIVFDNQGRTQVTLLFVVIVVIELSDVMFALDSVSAKVAQIPDQYIAFSSSVVAMFGLRAMFFVIQDLVTMFDLLKYGLGLILVIIGIELIFPNAIGTSAEFSSGITMAVILTIFVVCIIGSYVKAYLYPGYSKEDDSHETDNADVRTNNALVVQLLAQEKLLQEENAMRNTDAEARTTQDKNNDTKAFEAAECSKGT